jgi:hypothetical protein
MVTGTSRRGWRALIAGVLALTMVACASDSDSSGGDGGDGGTTDDGGDANVEPTPNPLRLGIVMVDYEAIKDFVDFHRGDQERTAQIFVDWINENGGIGGRQIEPVYRTFNPIPGQEPTSLTTCTELTEDEEVFAVLGVFIDFTGDAHLCLARDHETILLTHELEQAWIDEAPRGLLVTPDSVLEDDVRNLITLLDEEGTLEGRTVAVLGDQRGQGRIDDVIVPGLEDAGTELGTVGVLTLNSADTTAAQAQFDSFTERWEDEGVDTFFIDGLPSSALQWVEQIKEQFPDALIIADAAATIEQARSAQVAGQDPNPYEGMLSVTGELETEVWEENETLAECVSVYEDATGETVAGPEEQEADADGRINQTWIAVRDFCGELLMFKQIAEAAGPELTVESWQEAVDTVGELTLPSTQFASLCEGKYAAGDTARIVEFDSSIGDTGNWRSVTEPSNVGGDRCS